MLLAIKLAMMMDELSNNVAAMTDVNQDKQFTMDVCILSYKTTFTKIPTFHSGTSSVPIQSSQSASEIE